MNDDKNKDVFKYLEDIRLSSKNKLIQLGILINSGGIVGILSITHAKPGGDLKQALLYFIMSICNIFLVELITNIIVSNSLRQIIKKDHLNEEVKLTDLLFFSTCINTIIWILNFLALAFGIHAIKLCFNYLTA